MNRFTAAVIVLLLVALGLIWLSAAAAADHAPAVAAFSVIPTSDERVVIRWRADVPVTIQRWRRGYAEPLPPPAAPAAVRATWIGGAQSTSLPVRSDPIPYPPPYPAPGLPIRPTLEAEIWPDAPFLATFPAGVHTIVWPPRVGFTDWTQFHQAGRDRYRLVAGGAALTVWTDAVARYYLPVIGN